MFETKQRMRFVSLFLLFISSSSSAVTESPLPAFAQNYLATHCTDCHGPETQKGDLRLDRLSADFSDLSTAALWQEARDRINLGEMPPDDEARPPIADSEKLTTWIAASLHRAARQSRFSKGRPQLRRLNRREYVHTVADLLHLKFPPGESPIDTLPPDGTAEGFDTVASALPLDPSLLNLYYRVARRLAERAIVDGPPSYPTERMVLEFEDIPESRAIGYLIGRLGLNPVEGGLALIEGDTRSYGMLRYPGRRDNNVAPINGFYRFTVRASGVAGANGETPRMRLTHDHPDDDQERILEVDVDAPWDSPRDYSVVVPRDTLGGELHVSMVNETRLYMSQRPGEHFFQRNRELGAAGDFAETIRLAGRKIAEGWGGDRSTPDPEKLDITQYPRLFVDRLVVEGPLYDQWPPLSHETLLAPAIDAVSETEKTKAIFAAFLPRAWRRPVSSEELTPILQLVQTERAHGASFHDAIRLGLTTALVSPKFLYQAQPDASDPSTRLNDYQLASRLAYFLWSSMPDKKLFALAARGRLSEPHILRQQVDRMLADPKIDRFIEGFASQWLKTPTFLNFAPDERLYRSYDKALGHAAVQEPLAFFREVLTKNLSVLNFLDSSFAMLNERLAEHYDLPGVKGEVFQRVSLDKASPRRGLLGMMGVHLAGSDGIRTKPVSRAVYVRDVLFNDPPNPPPPNAGEVEPNIKGERLTVRERLLQHQEIETCAACHRKLDPYGLALENFNVIGEWRERQDGEEFRGHRSPAIDPSGRLPNGDVFADFAGFREALLKQSDRFRRGLVEKLWIYALGRSIEPRDDESLDQTVQHLQENSDTIRDAIHQIVTRPQFLAW